MLMQATDARGALLCNVQNAAGRVFSHPEVRLKSQAPVPGDGCGVGYVAVSDVLAHPVGRPPLPTRVRRRHGRRRRRRAPLLGAGHEPDHRRFTDERVASIIERGNRIVPEMVTRRACAAPAFGRATSSCSSPTSRTRSSCATGARRSSSRRRCTTTRSSATATCSAPACRSTSRTRSRTASSPRAASGARRLLPRRGLRGGGRHPLAGGAMSWKEHLRRRRLGAHGLRLFDYEAAGPGLARLDCNEFAFAPDTTKWGASWRAAEVAVHRYPDVSGLPLREALARRWHVEPDEILLGNGSVEILAMLMTAFGGRSAVRRQECSIPIRAFPTTRRGAAMAPRRARTARCRVSARRGPLARTIDPRGGRPRDLRVSQQPDRQSFRHRGARAAGAPWTQRSSSTKPTPTSMARRCSRDFARRLVCS